MTTAAIPLVMSGIGTVLSASGQMSAGNASAAAGYGQQAVLDQQAGQVAAQGSQEVANQNLKTKAIIGTLRARAASGGGSASDPTVVNLAGNIAARGEYNALSALYSADEKASGLQYQGDLAAYSGQVKQTAARTTALATAISGFGGLAAKYGNVGGVNAGTMDGPTRQDIYDRGYGYM